jgi:hypothetical protein
MVNVAMQHYILDQSIQYLEILPENIIAIITTDTTAMTT